MKLSNFLNLSFHEASEHIRKSIDERIIFYWSTSADEIIGKIKKINLEDVTWITNYAPHLKIKKNQGYIKFSNQHIISRISAEVTLYYDDYFTVTYHIGNTRNGVTLREISLAGNGIYWSEVLPELNQISLRDSVIPEKAEFIIPRIYYRNGRKGSLGDFIKKQYNLIKMRYQVACQDFADYVKSGKLKEAFDQVKENDADPWSAYYRYRTAGVNEFSSNAIQVISDPAGLSLLSVVTYVKAKAGYFYEFPETSNICRTFYSNNATLSGGQVKSLLELQDRVKKNYELEKKLEVLRSHIKTAADYYIQDFVQDNPKYTIKVTEGRLMRVTFGTYIDKANDL